MIEWLLRNKPANFWRKNNPMAHLFVTDKTPLAWLRYQSKIYALASAISGLAVFAMVVTGYSFFVIAWGMVSLWAMNELKGLNKMKRKSLLPPPVTNADLQSRRLQCIYIMKVTDIGLEFSMPLMIAAAIGYVWATHHVGMLVEAIACICIIVFIRRRAAILQKLDTPVNSDDSLDRYNDPNVTRFMSAIRNQGRDLTAGEVALIVEHLSLNRDGL